MICKAGQQQCAPQAVRFVGDQLVIRERQHKRDHSKEVMSKKNQRRGQVINALSKPKGNPVKDKSRSKSTTTRKNTARAQLDDSSKGSDMSEEAVQFDDTTDDATEVVIMSEESDDSSSSSGICGDAVSDERLVRMLEEGVFNMTPEDEARDYANYVMSKRFTGITNNSQTCFAAVLLQGISMIYRLNPEPRLKALDREWRGLCRCLTDLNNENVRCINIDRALKQLLDYHNYKTGKSLVFGEQIDPCAILETLISLIESWRGEQEQKLFEHSVTLYHRRDCECEGFEMYQQLWDIGVTSQNTFYQLTNLEIGGNEAPITVQDLLYMELVSTAPRHVCGQCCRTTLDSTTRVLFDKHPISLITNICRSTGHCVGDGSFVSGVNEREVIFEQSLTIPCGPPGEQVHYATYYPVSIVCQLGSDAFGHYVIYHLDDRVVCVNDDTVRLANQDDVKIMTRRCVFIFWDFAGIIEDEAENVPPTHITVLMDRLRNGGNEYMEYEQLHDDETSGHGIPERSPNRPPCIAGEGVKGANI